MKTVDTEVLEAMEAEVRSLGLHGVIGFMLVEKGIPDVVYEPKLRPIRSDGYDNVSGLNLLGQCSQILFEMLRTGVKSGVYAGHLYDGEIGQPGGLIYQDSYKVILLACVGSEDSDVGKVTLAGFGAVAAYYTGLE